MTEPYRGPSYPCPGCGGPLREFHERLVCDSCQGILIEVGDLAQSIDELVGESGLEVTLGSNVNTGPNCPRCTIAMSPCRLATSWVRIKTAYFVCENHGFWLPGGELAAVFAIIGHAAGEATSSGRRYAPRLGPDGLVPPVRTLAISAPRGRSRPPLTPVNAFADKELACPVCAASKLAFRGNRYVCAVCQGAFVENGALVAMVSEISQRYWEMPEPATEPGARNCPVCASAMFPGAIEGVPVDRCSLHGVWFDAAELTRTLENAAMPDPPVQAGIGAWLRRLFSSK